MNSIVIVEIRDKLKTEIEAVRNKEYENTDIVNMRRKLRKY